MSPPPGSRYLTHALKAPPTSWRTVSPATPGTNPARFAGAEGVAAYGSEQAPMPEMNPRELLIPGFGYSDGQPAIGGEVVGVRVDGDRRFRVPTVRQERSD